MSAIHPLLEEQKEVVCRSVYFKVLVMRNPSIDEIYASLKKCSFELSFKETCLLLNPLPLLEKQGDHFSYKALYLSAKVLVTQAIYCLIQVGREMKDTTGLSKTDVLMHTSDSIALHSADDQEFFKDFGMQHIIETEIFKITFFEWAQASLHCFARALARIDALEAKRLTMDLKCFRLFGEITVTQDFLASMRKTVINGRERVTTLARNAGFAESLQRVEESGAAVVVGGSSLGVLAQRRGGSATEDLTNVP